MAQRNKLKRLGVSRQCHMSWLSTAAAATPAVTLLCVKTHNTVIINSSQRILDEEDDTHTCQSIDSDEPGRAGDTDQMAVVVGNHCRKEGLVGLSRERYTTNKPQVRVLHMSVGTLHVRYLDENLKSTKTTEQQQLTDPEVGHGVDLHRLLNKRIGSVHKLLSGHDASVVHQDTDVAHFSLHLHTAEGKAACY